MFKLLIAFTLKKKKSWNGLPKKTNFSAEIQEFLHVGKEKKLSTSENVTLALNLNDYRIDYFGKFYEVNIVKKLSIGINRKSLY